MLNDKRPKTQKYHSGDTVGKWTILEFKGYSKGGNNTQYLCQCACGVQKLVLTTNLANNSRQCRKCRVQSLITRKHLMDQLWNVLNHGADRRKIEVKITKDDMLEQFEKQKRKCALTGLDLVIFLERNKYTQTTASLDRIDNTKGYLKDNIQWVHKKINRLKNDFNQNELIELCKLIVNYKVDSLI